jgi:hypothetical protein
MGNDSPGMGWEHKKRVAEMVPPNGQQCPCTGCNQHPGRCTTSLWPTNSEADHILARVNGGNNGPLRWMCRACNRSRGATLGNRLRGKAKPATPPPFTRPRW